MNAAKATSSSRSLGQGRIDGPVNDVPLFMLLCFCFTALACCFIEVQPVLMGSAVEPVELLHAYHFLDIMRDTPWVQRPPALVIFYHDGCKERMQELGLDKWYLRGLPTRWRLLVGRYNIERQYQSFWYGFDEAKMDLQNVLGIFDMTCPTLAMISRDLTYENRSSEILHVELWNPDEGDGNSIGNGIGNGIADGDGDMYGRAVEDWKTWVHRHVLLTFDQPVAASTCGEVGCFSARQIHTRDRVETTSHVRSSFIAPQVPTFTESGFKKIKMPDGLLEKLQEFYRKHKAAEKVEEWGLASQINFHEVKTSMVSLDLDPAFRNSVAQRYVRPLVEAWARKERLEMTAFYGIRTYYRGSELRMHIDRTETHVLSAILNIDQIGMDEDWLLEVIDHNGTRIEVGMEPGDLVLYESVTVPHGRPKPLVGDKYMNAFCHFRPIGWNYDTSGRNIVDNSFPRNRFVHNRRGRMKTDRRCPEEQESFASNTAGPSTPGRLIFRNFVPEEAVRISRVTAAGTELSANELPYRYQLEEDSYVGEAWLVRYARNNSLILEFVVLAFNNGVFRKTIVPCERLQDATVIV